MRKHSKFLGKFFLHFDLYGHKVDLYINSCSQVRSKFGALVSCVIFSICITLFINGFNDWLQGKNLQTISSFQNYNVVELLKDNKSFSYDLTYKNFDTYFSFYYNNGNGTNLLFKDLEKYLIQKMRYSDIKGLSHEVEFEKCLKRHQSEFLLEDFNETDNRTSNSSVCIKSDTTITLGLFANLQNRQIITPYFEYSIEKCRNSSENNNSCASEMEIMSVIPYIYVQVSLPKSIYDFKNTENPRKRTYDYQFFTLGTNVVKFFNQIFTPVYLYTDKGIFEDDYYLDSVDLTPGQLLQESSFRSDDNDLLFSFISNVGLDQEIYYRRNDKIQKLIGNFGGSLNFFIIIGKLLCTSYNFLKLKHKLINISFANLEHKKEKM